MAVTRIVEGGGDVKTFSGHLASILVKRRAARVGRHEAAVSRIQGAETVLLARSEIEAAVAAGEITEEDASGLRDQVSVLGPTGARYRETVAAVKAEALRQGNPREQRFVVTQASTARISRNDAKVLINLIDRLEAESGSSVEAAPVSADPTTPVEALVQAPIQEPASAISPPQKRAVRRPRRNWMRSYEDWVERLFERPANRGSDRFHAPQVVVGVGVAALIVWGVFGGLELHRYALSQQTFGLAVGDAIEMKSDRSAGAVSLPQGQVLAVREIVGFGDCGVERRFSGVIAEAPELPSGVCLAIGTFRRLTRRIGEIVSTRSDLVASDGAVIRKGDRLIVAEKISGKCLDGEIVERMPLADPAGIGMPRVPVRACLPWKLMKPLAVGVDPLGMSED
jgi:hypothetical protein